MIVDSWVSVTSGVPAGISNGGPVCFLAEKLREFKTVRLTNVKALLTYGTIVTVFRMPVAISPEISGAYPASGGEHTLRGKRHSAV